MTQQKLNRRKFLQISAAGAAGLVLASCTAPATPVAPQEPAATKPPAAEKATSTPIPVQEATATAVPTVAASQYGEAPALADMVKSGKLPPIEERLPVVPLVLAPINKTGVYGGKIRSVSGWLGGHWEESQYGHSALRWIDDGLGVAPGMCDTWETNADNTVWTFHVRQGLKWSDGTPCTTADIMYWWNDMVLNPEHPDNPPDFGTAGGKVAEFKALDDFSLQITYVEPAPLTAKRLAMWVNGNIGPRWITPMHYMKQFHPKYNPDVKDFTDHDQKILFRQNPDCPTLTSWMCEKFDPSVSITWTRNPYYYAVDTEGNQLPYIDGIDELSMAEREVQLANVIQGSVDFLHFGGFTLGDVSTLKDNEAKGNFETVLWDSGSGTGQMYFWNYDFPEQKKRDLYRDPKFKAAMSHALNRPAIQKTVYYGTGFLTTGTMSPKAAEFNFNAEAQDRYIKYRDNAVAYDPEAAKALLDEIGVKDVDGDGMREYPDGSKLEIKIDLPADASKECLDVLQIASANWKEIGLNIIENSMPPAEFGPLWHGGKGEIHTNWEVGDGPDHMLYPSWVVPNEPDRWAPLCGNMLVVQGTEKEETQCDVSPWERNPPRFCKSDAEYAGTPVEKLHAIYEKAKVEVDELKRHAMVWEMLDLHYENIFYIGTVANYPRIIIKSKSLDNVPAKDQLKLGGFVNPWIIPFPAVTNPETYYFTNL